MNAEGRPEQDNRADLQQSLREYRALLENRMVGLAFIRSRTVLHCNHRFAEMFGWTPEELAGKSTSILYPSEKAFRDMGENTAQQLARLPRMEGETLGKRRDGSLFWCHVHGLAIDVNDPSEGLMFLIEDITERRRAQSELVRAQQELERRVQERTLQLAMANARLEAEVQERWLAEERIRHMAHHDGLTGLPNRRLLEDRLEQAMGRARRDGTQVAVQFIDLDMFRSINERCGHRTANLLLQAVAKRMRQLLREADTVARIGGDEFVLVLPDIESRDAAAEAAERVLQALSLPYVINDGELTATASIGVCIYPEQGDDVHTLISRADAAMYQAKQAGRHSYRLFDDSSVSSE